MTDIAAEVQATEREALGRLVRDTWIAYCHEIGDNKQSHLAPWEDLSESDKEVDRRIGEAVARQMLAAVDALQAERVTAVKGYRDMRARLKRNMAECNGRIRIKALDYRATRDPKINAELNEDTAFRNGLNRALADLDHFFPMYFVELVQEDAQDSVSL